MGVLESGWNDNVKDATAVSQVATLSERLAQHWQTVPEWMHAELAELFSATEWERRWYWSFSGYAPILRICRACGIPLVALDVDIAEVNT